MCEVESRTQESGFQPNRIIGAKQCDSAPIERPLLASRKIGSGSRAPVIEDPEIRGIILHPNNSRLSKRLRGMAWLASCLSDTLYYHALLSYISQVG